MKVADAFEEEITYAEKWRCVIQLRYSVCVNEQLSRDDNNQNRLYNSTQTLKASFPYYSPLSGTIPYIYKSESGY